MLNGSSSHKIPNKTLSKAKGIPFALEFNQIFPSLVGCSPSNKYNVPSLFLTNHSYFLEILFNEHHQIQ